jgi:MFS family permease
MKGSMFVVFLTVVLDLVGFGIVIPLLSFYAEDYGASAIQVTLLMAIYSLAQFFFAPVWGALSDRIGRRPVLLGSIGAGSLMLAGFAWADSLWLLFVFRGMHGVFAANISTAQAYMADITTPEKRAGAMGLIGAAFGLGFTIGPLIGGELSVYGYSAPIWLAAGLGAFNFVLALFLLPESLKPDSTRRPRPISPAVLWGLLRHPVVGGLLALSLVSTLSFAMMESTFALFEEHRFGLGAQEVGRVLGLIGLVMIVVQGGLVRRLVPRFGEAKLVRVGIPMTALALIALPFAPPMAALYGVCGVLAVAQGLASPSLYSLLSRAASDSDQGLVMGTNQSLAALARAVGPTIAGLLYANVALSAPMVGAGILLLSLGTFLAFFATRSARQVAA